MLEKLEMTSHHDHPLAPLEALGTSLPYGPGALDVTGSSEAPARSARRSAEGLAEPYTRQRQTSESGQRVNSMHIVEQPATSGKPRSAQSCSLSGVRGDPLMRMKHV
jgi:hypothetical protein